MEKSALLQLLHEQRSYFASGVTKELAFRLEQLAALRQTVLLHEQALFDALRQDLGKPAFEAYAGETAIVLREIDHAMRHLRSWSRPRRVPTPLAFLPARSAVHPEPYGVALIIGPWNFPVQLLLVPLVAALAAGNCAVLKPSPAVPRTSSLLAKLLRDTFDPACVATVEGDAETARLLLEERFDVILYTGGAAAARSVMAAAAKHLTPLVLELGGKNPCIVDGSADLDVTARRIVWGKFFNAGQSCVAVDHLLVDRRVKEELLTRIVATIRSFYGDDPAQSPDLGRIVNGFHFDRLLGLLRAGTIVAGGGSDRAKRYIAPTVIDDVTPADPVMGEEVFGPILPVMAFDDLSEAIAQVNGRPKPLALYFFSRDRARQERVLRETSSGGACINETTVHFTVCALPFGGVGESGIGAYHGRAGFNAFSHERSVVRNGFLVDVFLRYPPYRDHLRWLRRLF